MMRLIDTEAGQLRDSAGMIEAEAEALRDVQCYAARIARRRLPPGEKIRLESAVAISRMNCYRLHCYFSNL
jgi:hypothetical protein